MKTPTIKLEPHEIALIFPPMLPAEYQSLRDDIGENGLIQAIVLHEGKILDGRHRYKACIETGTPIKTIQFKDLNYSASPETYVIQANLHRRHLSIPQRAFLAVMLYKTMVKDAAKERAYRCWETRRTGRKPMTDAEASKEKISHKIGALFGVGKGTVARAAMVEKRRPDLAHAIIHNQKVEGKLLTINMASRMANIAYQKSKVKSPQTPPLETIDKNAIREVNDKSIFIDQIKPVDMFTPIGQLVEMAKKINESKEHKILFRSSVCKNGKKHIEFRDFSIQRVLIWSINAAVQKMNAESKPKLQKAA